jgi:hypothetical protein
MNAVFAFRDEIHYFIESKLSRVTGFKRTPRSKADVMDRENYRVKETRILIIERAVNEDVSLEIRRNSGHVKC